MSSAPLPPPEALLPHRPPFLFIDRVSRCEERHVVAHRLFPADEPFFAGHFPTRPVVPGVILIEGLAQTLGYWALRDHPDHWVLLTGVEGAKFSQPVSPGDEVRFMVEIQRARRGLVVAQGSCYVGDQQVARAEIKGFLQPRESEST